MTRNVVIWTVVAAVVFFFIGGAVKANSIKKKIEGIGADGTKALDAIK